jgi:hypothetical protein
LRFRYVFSGFRGHSRIENRFLRLDSGLSDLWVETLDPDIDIVGQSEHDGLLEAELESWWARTRFLSPGADGGEQNEKKTQTDHDMSHGKPSPVLEFHFKVIESEGFVKKADNVGGDPQISSIR